MRNTKVTGRGFFLSILIIIGIVLIVTRIQREKKNVHIDTYTFKTECIESINLSYNSGYVMYLDTTLGYIKIICNKKDCENLMRLYSEYNTSKNPCAIKDSISNTFEIKHVNDSYILERCK